MVIEGVFEGDGVVVADGRALSLQAHDDGLGRMSIQKLKHCQQDIFEPESSISIAVIDVQSIIP